MYTKDEPISLANVMEGAAIEAVDHELRRVWENVMDPNTTDAARTVTLKIKVKPGKGSRELCDFECGASSTLAPVKPCDTRVYVGVDETGATASELKSGHQITFDQDNVAEIGGAQ